MYPTNIDITIHPLVQVGLIPAQHVQIRGRNENSIPKGRHIVVMAHQSMYSNLLELFRRRTSKLVVQEISCILIGIFHIDMVCLCRNSARKIHLAACKRRILQIKII